MAYEIQQGAHLQLSPLNLSFDAEANFKNTSKGGVQFNFQHDLESVWWLLLWIVTRGVEHSDSHQFARRVFSNQTRPSQDRTQMFMHPIQLSDALTKQLHSSVQKMARPFVVALDLHHVSYTNRLKDNQIDNVASYSTIHKNMHDFLKILKSKLSSPVTLKLRSQSRNTPPLRVKRKHSDVLYSDHDMENQTKRKYGLDS